MSDQLPVDASDRGRDGGSLLGLRAEKLRERLPEFVSGVAVSRSATRPRVIDRADHPARQSPKSANLSPTTACGREPRHFNILFGFMHPTVNETVAVLDASFLNPAVIKL